MKVWQTRSLSPHIYLVSGLGSELKLIQFTYFPHFLQKMRTLEEHTFTSVGLNT